MNSSAHFWDRIAARYAAKPIADEAVYQKKLKITREYFRPDMQLLELGCGTGGTALLHAPYVKQVRAVDISSEMLAIATTKAAELGIENVSFEQAAIDEFDTKQQFDMVLALSILHLLEDKQAAISKIHKLLTPGGIFVSSTVCLGLSMRWLQLVAPIARLFGLFPPTLKFFSATELAQALTAAGFEISYQWQPNSGRTVFIVARKI